MADLGRKFADVTSVLLALAALLGVAACQPDVRRIDTSLITVNWTLPAAKKTAYSGLKVSFNGGGVDFISNKVLNDNTTVYTIEGLKSSTVYAICIHGVKKSDSKQEPVWPCKKVKTLAPLRTDAVIALILVIAYILLCVLIGWCVWRHQRKNKSRRREKGSRDLTAASYNNDIEDDDYNSLNHGRYVKRTHSDLQRSELGRTSL